LSSAIGSSADASSRYRRRQHTGSPRRRLIALFLLLCIAFATVVARLTYLQGVAPERYAALGQSQRRASVVLPADRGSIFDRNGAELALSIQQRTIWVDPRLVTDPAAEAAALAPILQMDVADLTERLSRSGAFVYLKRRVDDAVAEKVERLELPGVFHLDEPARFTPAGDLGRSLMGSVGVDNDGLSGLELKYEKSLTGEPGELLFERAPDGRTISVGHHHTTPAEPGNDLVLTIDRSLQYEAERQLLAQVQATGSRGGMAIVMQPHTGEIVAMANVGTAAESEPPQPSHHNMAVTDVFEPGSVNKLITVAGALEEGLVNPNTVLDVPDHLQVSVHRFSDHDPHPPARWSVTDILTTSSNVGTIMLAQKLGEKRVDAYLRKFGFGKRTALDFPGESAGLMLDPSDWSGTSIGSIPIGQGLSVTALQMLLAYNTIANDGIYVEPKLVRATVGSDGEERTAAPSERHRVVSARTARQMSAMLAEVVRSGTGTSAAIDGYTVAGKTGTARKPLEGARGYEPGAYVASFAGFVPAERPSLSTIVVLDKPRTVYYASLVSAPTFASLSQYGLRLFRIPPPVAS
jgi:cell division protein FtsI (penicillin-binding protein 3)